MKSDLIALGMTLEGLLKLLSLCAVALLGGYLVSLAFPLIPLVWTMVVYTPIAGGAYVKLTQALGVQW